MKVFDCPSMETKDVVKEVNMKFDDVFHESHGKLVGKVCLCCDRMTPPGKLKWIGKTNVSSLLDEMDVLVKNKLRDVV